MSGNKDKTFNTVRILSNKGVDNKQGSVVTNGGVYVGGEIMCGQNIYCKGLLVNGTCKIANDLSVGGNIYCPNVYSVYGDNIKFRKKIIPDRDACSKINPLTIGSYKQPWETVFSEKIKSSEIDTMCITTPSFQTTPTKTNVVSEFNIINPKTNCIYFKASGSYIESYCPIYQQWNSYRILEINYTPTNILHLTTSVVFLDITNANGSDLSLFYDANLVPDCTKIKTYFFSNKISTCANYKLTVTRFNKKYVYTSKVKVKCIKLYFSKDCTYFLL